MKMKLFVVTLAIKFIFWQRFPKHIPYLQSWTSNMRQKHLFEFFSILSPFPPSINVVNSTSQPRYFTNIERGGRGFSTFTSLEFDSEMRLSQTILSMIVVLLNFPSGFQMHVHRHKQLGVDTNKQEERTLHGHFEKLQER